MSLNPVIDSENRRDSFKKLYLGYPFILGTSETDTSMERMFKKIKKHISRPFPVMNIRTSIRDCKCDQDDTINLIIHKAKRIEKALGNVFLMSDGTLKKGYDPNLITKTGYFNISKDDTDRLYWDDGKNFFNTTPYFIDPKGEVILGHELCDKFTYKYAGYRSFATLYKRPLFSIEGLYNNNGIKQTKGIINQRDNLSEKLSFLEQYIGENLASIKDKSGFKPTDTIVKNPKTKLKILEQHYKNNVEY